MCGSSSRRFESGSIMSVPFSFQYAAAILSGRTSVCDEARVWAEGRVAWGIEAETGAFADGLAVAHASPHGQVRDRCASSSSHLTCGPDVAHSVLNPLTDLLPLHQLFKSTMHCSSCILTRVCAEVLTVSCVMLGGDELAVPCHPRFTVGDLREDVSEWLGIPFEAVALSFQGQMLEDDFVHVYCIYGIEDVEQPPVIAAAVYAFWPSGSSFE